MNLMRRFFGWVSPGNLVKEVWISSNSYKEARETLIRTPLSSPVYFAIGGINKNEGTVITRDRSRAVDIWNLNDRTSNWILPQTNYDWWIKDSPEDDKNRINDAYILLNAIGKENLNDYNIVRDVLQMPNIHHNGTIYSTVMRAEDDYMETYQYV